jgi:hypothetical protein
VGGLARIYNPESYNGSTVATSRATLARQDKGEERNLEAIHKWVMQVTASYTKDGAYTK